MSTSDITTSMPTATKLRAGLQALITPASAVPGLPLPPRRGSTPDDQLAHIIHVDEGTPRATFREATRRHTLTHRRPTREHQRQPTHNSADPGHVEDPDLLAIVVDMEGQQSETAKGALPEARLISIEGVSLPRRTDQLADTFAQGVEG
ncbi:hypothetical protein [Kribbella sindirgiensis]|uniref:Uncharacterized protein n=1 Tax=Kribbella sindirgiensis TaxID=1124744 RepID=A0A4R0I778_9ACTN|nr:hypothetical protein [Kribbella sindirgiensis]TCC22430.1 hypothetical protein E0H50_35275 [Kribbella sindirgiensis]